MTHTATVDWQRAAAQFTDNQYSRGHRWRFDGGAEVAASASPQIVPVPWSDPAAVDPEEAFVAALSSCHMLWFLSLAAKRGLRVDRYLDDAVGEMGPNEAGRLVMRTVTLRPRIEWDGVAPDLITVRALHAAAHHECFLANSVRTEVLVVTDLQVGQSKNPGHLQHARSQNRFSPGTGPFPS